VVHFAAADPNVSPASQSAAVLGVVNDAVRRLTAVACGHH
jgi:hypothetical protein